MNVQLKKMAAACAFALGAFSGAALAHGPVTTPDVTIHMGGATAQDAVFFALIEGLMQPGTFDEYYDDKTANGAGFDTANDGKDFRAVFGTWKLDSSNLAGKKVLVVKRSSGGSIWGVSPIVAQETIKFMKVNSTLCSLGASATTVSEIPDVGLSDVEPVLFTDGANQPAVVDWVGDNFTPPTDTSSLNTASLFALGFGVQTDLANPITNLTRQQYASIAAGLITDWNKIDSTKFPLSTPITVCRRSAGSGTQAFSNAYFLNAGGCGNAVAPTDQAGDPAHQIDNVATGNVRSCLASNANSVGFISLEDDPTQNGGGRKWISINGVGVPNPASPTAGCVPGTGTCNTDNMKNGTSDMYSEQSFNAPATTAAKPGYYTKAEIDAFISVIKTKAPLASVLSGRAKAGILSLASQPAGASVIDYSRSGNTCNPSTYQR